MNTFVGAFHNAWERMKQKKWDCIYVLVDVHGVIMAPNYEGMSGEIYPECIAPMQLLSADPRVKLIMWTCSSPEHIERYRARFAEYDITFEYANSNPEVDHLEAVGDYRTKLYANVILDDKGGFHPRDWPAIESWYNFTAQLEKVSEPTEEEAKALFFQHDPEDQPTIDAYVKR